MIILVPTSIALYLIAKFPLGFKRVLWILVLSLAVSAMAGFWIIYDNLRIGVSDYNHAAFFAVVAGVNIFAFTTCICVACKNLRIGLIGIGGILLNIFIVVFAIGPE